MTYGRTTSLWLLSLYFCRILTRTMRPFRPATSQPVALYVAMRHYLLSDL